MELSGALSRGLFCPPDFSRSECFTTSWRDREKPGAERAAKLILVYYVPPETLSRWHPSMDTETEAIQSSPRFFLVSC